MNFFAALEKILFAEDPDQKIALFREFHEDFHYTKKYDFDHQSPIKISPLPSYHSFCQIIHPTRIRRPKDLSSTNALAKVIHSIVHIEYSAIDLALDASYRFRNLSPQYYTDWLEVAQEEISHFLLLRSLLQDLGFDYGDFPVHQNLFDAQMATNHSLSHRMGLVHRALEANGLDANPFVAQKISQSSHAIAKKALSVLDIILRDEISHVHKGDKWWRAYKKEGEDFLSLLRDYRRFSPMSKILNKEARLQAGYTKEELLLIERDKPMEGSQY
ncbi:Uncharacterized protein conserved in bacteria [Helicobacter mustelae]|uniref:ferritin-like domain-containing protein n=1 Tax=Helicobacter mustelae TaxID=217 RepID=UPI000DFDC33F|nr:ferritin-like domain-containing protein [Helicobacter mustelae]STP12457.1 Uncharacterized protein conserved in bacteria [Helicobacter mustelae]